jgi:hypothetical protein
MHPSVKLTNEIGIMQVKIIPSINIMYLRIYLKCCLLLITNNESKYIYIHKRKILCNQHLCLFIYMYIYFLERPNLFAVCNNTFSKWWEGIIYISDVF